MSIFLKREVPIVIASLLIVIVITNHFFTFDTLDPIVQLASKFTIIIAGFSLLLGGTNLAQYHSRQISRRTEGQWIYSAIMLVSMVIFLILGFGYKPTSAIYQLWYNSIIQSFQGTVYSILGFFIIWAAYRAFKIRSYEATILLLASLLTIIGRAPVGAAIWEHFPFIGNWLNDVPNKAGQQALRLIIGLGTMGWALQVLIGRESRWAGSE